MAYLQFKLKNPWSLGVHHRQQAQSDEHASASVTVSIFRALPSSISQPPSLKGLQFWRCLCIARVYWLGQRAESVSLGGKWALQDSGRLLPVATNQWNNGKHQLRGSLRTIRPPQTVLCNTPAITGVSLVELVILIKLYSRAYNMYEEVHNIPNICRDHDESR